MAQKTAVNTYTNPSFGMQPQGPVWETLPETSEQAVHLLKNSPLLYGSYQSLDAEWKQRFLDFCQGKKSLPLTYDPFFKRIFHPDIHPDRLSRLVSSILGIQVKVLHILPSEDSMIDGASLLIMDLVGELEDGSLTNIDYTDFGIIPINLLSGSI